MINYPPKILLTFEYEDFEYPSTQRKTQNVPIFPKKINNKLEKVDTRKKTKFLTKRKFIIKGNKNFFLFF